MNAIINATRAHAAVPAAVDGWSSAPRHRSADARRPVRRTGRGRRDRGHRVVRRATRPHALATAGAPARYVAYGRPTAGRSEEHTSEPKSIMRISYAV